LALLPRLELYAVGPAGYEEAMEAGADDGRPYGMVVFDRFVPDLPPPLPTLWIGPDQDGPFGTLGAAVDGPALAPIDADDPLLRFLDLSTLHVGRARAVELADGMRAAVSSTEGEPLIAAGRVDGRTQALLAFELGETDLPLQVAFPLLVSSLTDFLLPPTDGVLPPSVDLGEALVVQLNPAISRVRVDTAPVNEDPDTAGQALELDVVGGRVTLPGARRPGVVRLTALDGLAEGADPVLGTTAANLFDPGESRVAPGDPLRISDLGRVGPGTGGEPLPARNEWWWPLALVALLLLLAEWVLFHRPSRRAAARLLGRGGRGAAPSVSRPAGGTTR
jgi:Ca-activated chloride channel homolog